MSVPACVWASQIGRERKLSCPERVTLWQLAERSNGKGFCWPSIVRLMDDTGLCKQTQLTVVHALAEKGLIRIERQGQKHVYYVLRHIEPTPEPVYNQTGKLSTDRSKSRPDTGLNVTSDRSKSDTRTGLKSLPEPIKRTYKENLGRADAREPEKNDSHFGEEESKAAASTSSVERAPTPAEIEHNRKATAANLAALPPAMAAVFRRLGSELRHVEHAPGRPPTLTVGEQIAVALGNGGPVLHGEIIAPQPPIRTVAEQLAILRGETVLEDA